MQLKFWMDYSVNLKLFSFKSVLLLFYYNPNP
jgi:hypothetical protein